MHESLTFTLVLFMLFIDNKFSLMNAIHTPMIICQLTLKFYHLTVWKNLCAWQKHLCLCDLIVHCSRSNCRLNCRHAFVNLDSVLKCNVASASGACENIFSQSYLSIISCIVMFVHIVAFWGHLVDNNQTIASCVVLTHQVALLMVYFIILLPNTIMTRWLFIKA